MLLFTESYEECKRKKAKCDRLLPFSSLCSETSNQCDYTEQQKLGAKVGSNGGIDGHLERMELLLRDIHACIPTIPIIDSLSV